MTKFVYAIVILLGGSAASALGQPPTAKALSSADTTSIVISILDSGPIRFFRFYDFRAVSSDNLEFVDSAQLEKHGIRLVSASFLEEAQKDHVVRYLLFRKISFRDGVAVITLAQITEGRACFASHMHSESTYTYEVQRTPNGLSAKLISGPAPQMFLDFNPSSLMHYLGPKPNNSLDRSGGSVFRIKPGAANVP